MISWMVLPVGRQLRRAGIAFAALAYVIVHGSAFADASSKPAPIAGDFQATFEQAVAGVAKIDVESADHKYIRLKIDGAGLTALSLAGRGDQLTLTVDNILDPTYITKVERIQRAVGIEPRLLAFVLPLALLMGVAASCTKWRPQRFLLGIDGLYSDSQVQLAVWFGCLAIVYAATWALRIALLGAGYAGHISITENLLGLSGLSAISFGGAKVLASSKNAAVVSEDVLAKAQAAAVAAGQPQPSPQKPRFLIDLVTNSLGQPDLGDFQMMLITVVVAATYVVMAWNWLGTLDVSLNTTLPDVDTTLLASFGVGQGAYLFKKGAMPPAQG